jgi:hypothetical protein
MYYGIKRALVLVDIDELWSLLGGFDGTNRFADALGLHDHGCRNDGVGFVECR